MTQNYKITGMTCNGCRSKVQHLLEEITGVKGVEINLEKGEAAIEMNKTIPEQVFKSALQGHSRYQITQTSPSAIRHADHAPAGTGMEEPGPKSWLATYKPLLLIFLYITLISLISARSAPGSAPGFDPVVAMRVFMAGFFLTFSKRCWVYPMR